MLTDKIYLNGPNESYKLGLSVSCDDELRCKAIYDEIVKIDGLSEDSVKYAIRDNKAHFSIEYKGPCVVDSMDLHHLRSAKGLLPVVTGVGRKG